MPFRLIINSGIFLFLTLLTQIGGAAYLATLAIKSRLTGGAFTKTALASGCFLACYACLGVTAHFLAPYFGRVALPCRTTGSTTLVVQSPVFCALNRHYVTPELFKVTSDLAAFMDKEYPGTRTLALDANFPFIDGFPLVPHLSHDDGRKLDLAFYYRRRNGRYVAGATKSPIGYWAFEETLGGEQPCSGKSDLLTLRWDVPWFRFFHRDYELDVARNRAALQWLTTTASATGVSKVLVEPHLAQRLNVNGGVIRFQGCRASRHDDHIHFQVRAE